MCVLCMLKLSRYDLYDEKYIISISQNVIDWVSEHALQTKPVIRASHSRIALNFQPMNTYI